MLMIRKLTVYEMVLENFSKMKAMSIRNAPSISSLISLSLENNVYSLMEDFDKDPDEVQKFLSDRSEMMSEYFSISFAGGMVRSLPMIIENYAPFQHSYIDCTLKSIGIMRRSVFVISLRVWAGSMHRFRMKYLNKTTIYSEMKSGKWGTEIRLNMKYFLH
jgi:hypothetical protein